MSDRETLQAMFARAGVHLQEGGIGDPPNSLVMEAKKGPNNEGYTGFISVFTFNEDGSLKSVGAWE